MTESEFLKQLTLSINELLNGDYRVRQKNFPEKLTERTHENELRKLNQSVNSLIEKFHDADNFILNLSKGNLDAEVPKSNQLISPFKELQSNLRHLVWQTHRIAEGDYSQRIDFLGDFSSSYNYLISSLREKQALEEELKIYASELKELNATKDKFFSIIAHDLRNPFNALLNLTDFIIDSIEEDNKTRAIEQAGFMKVSAQNAFNLLQNLLDWSSIQQGGVYCNPAYEILLSLVKEELLTLENISNQKNIKIELSIPETLIVKADKNMLKTILRNLISNALKYTYDGGNIIVGAERVDTQVLIRITDSGTGMSEEELKMLFRLNTGQSKPGTKQEKGSGLGLILCKEFVTLHHGTIWVESEPGKGSTFFISLPL
jgi:signal transduction histidine kinase